MGYSQHMLAKTEHVRMVHTMPAVSEFGEHLAKPKRNKRSLRLAQLWPMFAAMLHIIR